MMMIAAQMDGAMGNVVVSTLALSVAAGGILMVLAKRLNIPGIVLLLFGGVILGPEGFGIIQPETLGPILNVLVAVAVGLILFEGGLTLDMEGYRSAPRVIRNLLTIGVVITWLGTALAIWLVLGLDPTFAVLAGSLVIVTGPTVIQPILKRIRLKWNLHNILHWEGVLIDPIGVSRLRSSNAARMASVSVVPASAKGGGVTTRSVSLVVTVRLPWAIAAVEMPTFSPTMIVPVRALMTTTAGLSTETLNCPTWSMKVVRPFLVTSSGTSMVTVPASEAWALLGKARLMTVAMSDAVEKSGFRSSRATFPLVTMSSVDSSSRSTSAPEGIRPTVGMFSTIVLAWPDTLNPPTERGPWATA